MSEVAHQRSLEAFLPYMRDVDQCQRLLQELALTWRMIEGSTRMSGGSNAHLILPTIAATRRNLDVLEHQLIHSLVEEKVASVMREISTKAFYAIDIVVRNLYERTADVAFLATDRELCTFLEDRAELVGEATRTADTHLLDLAANRARQRLAAYRRKYTVYDAVAVLAPDGTVIASDSDQALPEWCSDELVQQALEQDGYIECFAPSSLQPGKSASLIYCHRMMGPRRGQAVGVLFLCFDLDGEMAGIFATHRDPGARYNLLLLNGTGRCIASADPAWIPPGTTVPINAGNQAEWQIWGGRLYLVATRVTPGYQGYPGPQGWRGQVMIPLDLAFNASHIPTQELPPGLLEYAGEVCPPLQDVMQAAATIHRVVWNGQVLSVGLDASASSPSTGASNTSVDCNFDAILDQISETGARSDLLFNTSARGLYETVLAADLQDAGFVARLMVDLLDRNLYERANDCRWWALTEALQQALEQPDRNTLAEAQRTLSHINSLYTVYTSIFLYDRQGQVIARSLRDGVVNSMPEWTVEPATLQAVLSLENEQAYWVEGFAPSAGYNDHPTYVYHAAVRASGTTGRVVGGIGLVFDSAQELVAMIEGSLAGKPDTHACFVDRQGRIIAASRNSGLAVGAPFTLEKEQLHMLSATGTGRLLVHRGHYVIAAAATSHGYREFKRDDGYDDPVMAVVYHTLGPVRKSTTLPDSLLRPKPALTTETQTSYAVFSCAGQLYALEGIHIHEAVAGTALMPIAGDSGIYKAGMLSHQTKAGCKMAWVYSLAALLGEATLQNNATREESGAGREIIILRTPRGPAGLQVDALHTVGRYTAQPLMAGSYSESSLIREVLHVSDQVMIPVLDAQNLITCLQGQAAKC